MSLPFIVIPSPPGSEMDSMEVNHSPSLWPDSNSSIDSDPEATESDRNRAPSIGYGQKRKKHFCVTSDNEDDDDRLSDIAYGDTLSGEKLLDLWMSKISISPSPESVSSYDITAERMDKSYIPPSGTCILSSHSNYTNP